MKKLTLSLICLYSILLISSAQADIFNQTRFIPIQRWSVGIEPVLTLTDGAGAGINGRVTYGLNELLNVGGFIGLGGGPRQFRIGGYCVFDFFPDTDEQPGIGLVTQIAHYGLKTSSRVELGVAPYIHNAFDIGDGHIIDPFLAVPFGIALDSVSPNEAYFALVVGTVYNLSETVYFSGELGVNIDNYFTYVSGGIGFNY